MCKQQLKREKVETPQGKIVKYCGKIVMVYYVKMFHLCTQYKL